MVIVTEFEGDQKKFHFFWLPLIYKHNECNFVVKDKTGKMIFPGGITNLKVVDPDYKLRQGNVILKCPINKIPTYKAMVDLQNIKSAKTITPEELGSMFYEV
tara:strand:- start:1559 stop:1864 length:306 start_codon:yes stop_codon:yes gene_type:complete